MVTKKQLAALAYGRSVRKANIKNKCKSTKKKTKGTFDNILNELEKNGSDSAKIEVDGKKVEIHFDDSKRREEQKRNERWAKIGKITIGTATLAALTALGYHALKKNDITSWESLKKKLFDKGITQEEMGPVANGAISDNDDLKNKVAQEIYEELKNETPNNSLLPAAPKKPGIFKQIKNAASDAFDKANEIFNNLLKKMTKEPEVFGPENNFRFTYTPPPRIVNLKYDPEVYTFHEKTKDPKFTSLYDTVIDKPTPEGMKPIDPNKPSSIKIYKKGRNPLKRHYPSHERYNILIQKELDNRKDLINHIEKRKERIDKNPNQFGILKPLAHVVKNPMSGFIKWMGNSDLNGKKFNPVMRRFYKVIDDFDKDNYALDLEKATDCIEDMAKDVKRYMYKGKKEADFDKYYKELKDLEDRYIIMTEHADKYQYQVGCAVILYNMKRLLKAYYDIVDKKPLKP